MGVFVKFNKSAQILLLQLAFRSKDLTFPIILLKAHFISLYNTCLLYLKLVNDFISGTIVHMHLHF